jgi:hypothetical protein
VNFECESECDICEDDIQEIKIKGRPKEIRLIFEEN